jgi:hypothetical protein
MEAAVIPFPKPESTPPVTNTNLVGRFATSLTSLYAIESSIIILIAKDLGRF